MEIPRHSRVCSPGWLVRIAARHWLAPTVLLIGLTAVAVGVARPARAQERSGPAARPGATWHVLPEPIDPGQLTEMPFGTDSPWLQPWRSALTTRPATSLENAIGINFDMEVWNEFTFGSAFLDETNYYSPVPDPGSYGSVTDALLAATVQMLHDPANGLPGVKVGDGFANQEPWPSGTTVPAGTNAIDKHPYAGTRIFPGSPDEPGIEPLNALGLPNYAASSGDGSSVIHPLFAPSYRVFMPEYLLTGIQTETLMRDLSPITTDIYGTPHGDRTHPQGSPPPASGSPRTASTQPRRRPTACPPSTYPSSRPSPRCGFCSRTHRRARRRSTCLRPRAGPAASTSRQRSSVPSTPTHRPTHRASAV